MAQSQDSGLTITSIPGDSGQVVHTHVRPVTKHYHLVLAKAEAHNRVRSKLKVQNSSTFHELSMTQTAFLSTKIIDKKPYPRRGHSKFRLYLDTVRIFIKYLSKESELKYCFQVLVTCIQVLASKLSTNAKFQNLQD